MSLQVRANRAVFSYMLTVHEDAKWFSREQVLEVLAHPRGTNIRGRDANAADVQGHDDLADPPFYLPGTSAISGRLISDWAYRRE